jgi:hypothetical protein
MHACACKRAYEFIWLCAHALVYTCPRAGIYASVRARGFESALRARMRLCLHMWH